MCVNTLQRRRARQRQGAARSLEMLVFYAALPASGGLDKLGVVAGKFEGTEALVRVKVFQHVQEEFVQQSVIGLGRGEELQSGIVFWLDAVSRTILLEVEQAACTKSQISMCAERGGLGGGLGGWGGG